MNVSTPSMQRPAAAPVLGARVGDETVASAVDRSIRVRFDGDGPRASAPLLAETAAATKLLSSPAGAEFTDLVRSVAATANRDGARSDDLQTITFTPDLDAVKGVRVLNAALRASDEEGVTFSRREAASTARDVDANTSDYLSGTLAWNSGGHVVITPDISRTLLATVGAYRPQDGDDIALPWVHAGMFDPKSDVVREGTLAQRGNLVKEALLALNHERHHSDTPPVGVRESEVTAVVEEATAELIGTRTLGNVTKSIGGSLARLAERVGSGEDRSGLGWSAWNRDALAEPTTAVREEITRRYVDGTKTLRELVALTGNDLRTAAGLANATELLQGKQAMHVPRRLADAIRAEAGVPDTQRERFVDLVRNSFVRPDGLKALREALQRRGNHTLVRT